MKLKKDLEKNWNIALGLNQVDGLEPSKYMQHLVRKNIVGDLSCEEVEFLLQEHYEKKNSDLNSWECDLVAARIVQLLNDSSFVFSVTTFRNIHQFLFEGIYDLAGKYRNYNITKKEPVLNGKSVVYADYSSILELLSYDFNEEGMVDYSVLPYETQIKKIGNFTANIWQIHPFCEGNTRTTALFMEKYLRSLGYNVNNDLFQRYSVFFRNALVLANYDDFSKGIYRNMKYLYYFYENLLCENCCVFDCLSPQRKRDQ